MLENSSKDLKDVEIQLRNQIDSINLDKEELEKSLRLEIEMMSSEIVRLLKAKDDELSDIKSASETIKTELESIISEKENKLALSENTIEDMKKEIDNLTQLNAQTKDELGNLLKERENDLQVRINKVGCWGFCIKYILCYV